MTLFKAKTGSLASYLHIRIVQTLLSVGYRTDCR